MEFAVIIASFGVFILLLAFFLDSFQIVTFSKKAFFVMNIVGAAISCWASFLINFFPFVVLEAAWTIVAISGLIKETRKM